MRKNNYLKKSGFILFAAALTIVLITATALFSVSCSNKNNVKTDTTMAADAQTSQSGKDSQSTSGSSNSSTSTTVEETTTSEQVPSDIQLMIAEADKYYNNGQFAESVSAYRSIKPAVEKNATIGDSLKQEIIKSYSINFEDSKTITETARMHYGNAMQLEYEKRIDEAIKELEEALKIYPKYQDAIDKLDSIKSLYKLK